MQTQVSVAQGQLVVEPIGANKVWSLRRQLVVPLSQVLRVVEDPDAARTPKGFRAPGYAWPRTKWVGTFYRRDGKHYWAVRAGQESVLVELAKGAPFVALHLSVADAAATVALVNAALPAA